MIINQRTGWITLLVYYVLSLIRGLEAVPWPSEISSLKLSLNSENRTYITQISSNQPNQLNRGDIISHIDGIEVLSLPLESFMRSNTLKEAVIPIVDMSGSSNSAFGYELLGFVTIKRHFPKDVRLIRETEVAHQVGGSKILATEVPRSNQDRLTDQLKEQQIIQTASKLDSVRENMQTATKMTQASPIKEPSTIELRNMPSNQRLEDLRKQAEKISQIRSKTGLSEVKQTTLQQPETPSSDFILSKHSLAENKSGNIVAANAKQDGLEVISSTFDVNPKTSDLSAEVKPRAKVKVSPKMKPKSSPMNDLASETNKLETSDQTDKSKQLTEKKESEGPSIDDLYGEGKPYPSPNIADRMPREALIEMQARRRLPYPFIYSVQYRNSPLGLAFDNMIQDATRVERVIPRQQSELADVRIGDYLIAINHINTTLAPAKISLRILSTSPWPIVLVFEGQRHIRNPKEEARKSQAKQVVLSVIYPPSMISDMPVNVSEWIPHPIPDDDEGICNLFALQATRDMFGCSDEGVHSDYTLSPLLDRAREMLDFSGSSFDHLNASQEEYSDLAKKLQNIGYPLIGRLIMRRLYQILKINLPETLPRVLLRPAAVMRRGICTFVDKAKILGKETGEWNFTGMSGIGLLVNSDESFLDMPSGKEDTSLCVAPFGSVRSSEGTLLHASSQSNEVFGVLHGIELNDACRTLQSIVDDELERWPHSVPPISLPTADQMKTAVKDLGLRSIADEGGRLAVSGINGWAYFDYHLALFGPQEVPLGPQRLQMAYPPHGCEASQYTVRIKDTVVAILRGGGCSFGIKVLAAQQLGAKAVIIVNSEEGKTQRLMALPEEAPLIRIPCIMVSRRIQKYLENNLSGYAQLGGSQSQHIVSIQPMLHMSNYESRS